MGGILLGSPPSFEARLNPAPEMSEKTMTCVRGWRIAHANPSTACL